MECVIVFAVIEFLMNAAVHFKERIGEINFPFLKYKGREKVK